MVATQQCALIFKRDKIQTDMKNSYLKYPCMVAAFYFSVNLQAQQAAHDTITKEKKIEEVVVIGYGSQKKVNVTGSIASISGRDVANQPNPNPVSSIQGKVSGVQVVNAGNPGGSPRVDIRGVSALSGGTVFIVDGIITEDISFLNPADVESMSILKDPSSLAIYGSKATKGAVIITTKSGRGKPVFNFNSYVGVKSLTNLPKLANTAQYVELYNEKLLNSGVTDPKQILNAANYPADTDWLKEIYGAGFIHSSDVSAAGNWKGLGYYTSVGYLKDDGVLKAGRGINSGDDFGRLTTRVNLNYKLLNILTIGANTSWSHINFNNANNPSQAALISPPLYYPVVPGGTYGYQNFVSVVNPRANLDLYRSKETQDRFLLNPYIEVKFLKDFTFKTSYSREIINRDKYEFTPKMTYNPNQNNIAKLIDWEYKNRNYVWDNTLTWRKKLNLHNLELLAGYSRSEDYFHGLYQLAENVNYNGTEESMKIGNYKIADQDTNIHLTPFKTRIESVFGRINYDYAGRYLLNASVRRDGSSQYSADNRYHLFPAVSVGWVVSREGFMENQHLFSLLKLRASWGRLGNPGAIRDYDNLVTIINSGVYFGGIGQPAATVDRIVDTSIGWEITEGRDIGIEMGFLNNDLKIEATYFDKDTRDVVYGINQLATSGAANANDYVTNAFAFNNKGLEFGINYDKRVNENFKFGLYGNLTTLKNKITSVFANSYQQPGVGLFGNPIIRLQTGVPVGSYYGYKVEGIFQNAADVAAAPKQEGAQAGSFKFADINGDGVINEADKTFLGSPIPDLTYGFGLNMAYNAFDFAVDFQGVAGNEIYNFNRNQRFGNENWDYDFYKNRWHGAGTSNTYPLTTNDQRIIKPNSFYVEDGSFFRLRNVQVGYSLPMDMVKGMGLNKFRLYLSAQNPFTISKYTGFSPEIMNTDRVQMGIDNNIYPISAIYTMGVNVTF